MKLSRSTPRGPMPCALKRLPRRFYLLTLLSVSILNIDRASADISTNFGALDNVAPEKATPRKHDVSVQPAHRAEHSGQIVTSGAAPSMPPSHREAEKRVGPPPDVPPAPPKPIVIAPPPITVEAHPPVAPSPIVIDPKAMGRVQKTAHGMVLIYQAGNVSLNEKMLEALQKYAATLAKDPSLRISIHSYASGQADDPSVPRRISLARALTVRSVMINAGVATTRIYPRAEGLPKSDISPPDKLEIIATGAAPAPPSEAYYPHESQMTTP